VSPRQPVVSGERLIKALRKRSWLLDRSSRPHRSPRLLDEGAQRRICEWRERTGWGPRLVAGKVGRHHSTVWKVLARHGISRPANRHYNETRPHSSLGGRPPISRVHNVRGQDS
jgi:hypothetical protein